MSNEQIFKTIQALIILAVGLGYVLYLYQVTKNSVDKREKYYLIGTSLGFVMLMFVFIPLIFASLIGGYNGDERIPNYVIPFVFLIPFSLIVGGLTQIIFADEAVKIYKRRREQGKLDRWFVSQLPKREAFILRGGVIAATGSISLLIISFAIIMGA
jgi:hypothetical protein